MPRNCLTLRKTLDLRDFYRLSQEIALKYAKKPQDVARSYFVERYNITPSTFYTLLEFSITHHLIDDETSKAIQKKILNNQETHGNNGFFSKIKYKELENKREKYSAFLKKDIVYIANYYANNDKYSKEEIANYFCFYNTKVLDQILKKACVELIISDKTFEALYKRAIKNAINIKRTETFFDMLREARKQAKQKRKSQKSST